MGKLCCPDCMSEPFHSVLEENLSCVNCGGYYELKWIKGDKNETK